jgi:D-alanyl-D-alanine carboxypeptidase
MANDLDEKLTKLMADHRFSGAVLIAKDGKPLWERAYGYADREHKTPNKIDTLFRLGSMNKMVTAVSIAQLVQASKLRFSDTLAQVLPEYPNREVARRITIHQLLTHTSGLGDFFGPEFRQRATNYAKSRTTCRCLQTNHCCLNRERSGHTATLASSY